MHKATAKYKYKQIDHKAVQETKTNTLRTGKGDSARSYSKKEKETKSACAVARGVRCFMEHFNYSLLFASQHYPLCSPESLLRPAISLSGAAIFRTELIMQLI